MSSFNLDQARFNTQAIHAGYRRDSDFGALATPIYQTSTFTFTSADHAMGVFSGDIPGYDYTRAGNPTVRVFEEKIARLEGGEDAVATSSGMAPSALLCWACCAPAIISSAGTPCTAAPMWSCGDPALPGYHGHLRGYRRPFRRGAGHPVQHQDDLL